MGRLRTDFGFSLDHFASDFVVDFRLPLELLQFGFGSSLGRICGDLGLTLGRIRPSCGSGLAKLWDDFGLTLGQLWADFALALG